MRDIQYGIENGIESRLHAVDVALLICLYLFSLRGALDGSFVIFWGTWIALDSVSCGSPSCNTRSSITYLKFNWMQEVKIIDK